MSQEFKNALYEVQKRLEAAQDMLDSDGVNSDKDLAAHLQIDKAMDLIHSLIKSQSESGHIPYNVCHVCNRTEVKDERDICLECRIGKVEYNEDR